MSPLLQATGLRTALRIRADRSAKPQLMGPIVGFRFRGMPSPFVAPSKRLRWCGGAPGGLGHASTGASEPMGYYRMCASACIGRTDRTCRRLLAPVLRLSQLGKRPAVGSPRYNLLVDFIKKILASPRIRTGVAAV